MNDDGDPRLGDEYVRTLTGPGPPEDLVLVGVVHDHPASEYRVERVVEETDPDVLALELPPFALPLFEHYAGDGETPPASGEEMSAAIRAARDAEVAGIDGPTVRFVVTLARNAHRMDASPSTVQTVLRGLTTVTRQAIRCRLAAVLARWIGLRVEVDSPVAHECDDRDDPHVQAEDERSQIRRATAVTNAFGVPDSVRIRDATRERHMAGELSALRRRGVVVAVVGMGHLDPLAALLDDPETDE